MHLIEQSHADYVPEELAGADIIGGVVLGGIMSMVIWAGIIGAFLL
jgi:hypothetical protein